MRLYLVRHGDSLPGEIDDSRPLSAKGKMDIQNLAHFIVPLHIQVSYLFQSEKSRAQETAKILFSSIHVTRNIETRPELDPSANVDLMMDEVLAQNEDILLVGHMPYMGKLAGKLLTRDENKDLILFEPGCMVCLERMGHSEWIIRWIINPGLFKNPGSFSITH